MTEFVERLALGDRVGAVARTRELLDEGFSRADVRELIARAQHEVGRLWQSNTWTVAQEHIATGISESVLLAVGTSGDAAGDRGHVLVVCADGEWHLLPARLLAEELDDAGFRVTFAGGSMPAEHLVGTVRQLGPDVVAVSCTLSLNLAGAARTVAAVHAAGRPVLVGGAAFGTDQQRAAAVGADAWASDVAAATAIVERWVEEPPEREPPTRRDRAEADRLYREEARLVEDAYHRLGARFPDLSRYSEWQVDRTREDLAYHLRYLASAALVGDDGVYLEMLPWLRELLTSRGVGARAVDVTVEVLREVAAAESLPETQRILARA